MKIVYVGPYSGLFLSDLRKEIERGVPFEAPDKWFTDRAELEPGQWKRAVDLPKADTPKAAEDKNTK